MPTIKAVFDDPATTTRNPQLLAKRAGVTLKSAQAFLRQQEASQVSTQHRRPPDAAFAPTGGQPGEWLADTIYLTEYAGANAKRGAIFTLLNANSRYAYARALTKATSAKTAEAMKDILAENAEEVKKGVAPILSVRADGGPENRGEFAALLKKNGIALELGEAGTHERLGRIDRFHGSLRRMIGDWFAATDSHQWYKVLPDLVANYNGRPHSGLSKAVGARVAPADITPALEQKVRLADSTQAADVRARTDAFVRKHNVGPGTRVRLLAARMKGERGKFAKSHEMVWSPDTYSIVARAGPNSFTVDVEPGQVRTWPLHSLQIVTKALKVKKPGPKVDKKPVAAQRMEDRNIRQPREQKLWRRLPGLGESGRRAWTTPRLRKGAGGGCTRYTCDCCRPTYSHP